MTFHGNQYGRLGELVSNDVLDDVDAKDTSRQDSDRKERSVGSIGSAVLLVFLVGFLVIIAMGLAMILLG